ncbi:hypothetical protein OG410_41525 [Streptomyces sp. NBC_00659]|uniref:hypothetical protein n=1 Tax=Streptomyces sp. NBC_00659 TaxID=2903669 RepID=UPI002E357D28|nr:hypothetical protein [Streptomyces sp. NBC_00659]
MTAPWIAVLGLALAYDSLVVAVGAAAGEGALLEALNTGRFTAHAVLTPLAVVCGALLLGPGRRTARWAWAVAGALSVLGVLTTLPGLELEPRTWADTLRYTDAGAPVAAVVAILALLAIGVVVWRRHGVPWVALGALAVFVASALAFRVPPLGNLGEGLMLAGLLAALRDWRLDVNGTPAPVPAAR